MTTFGGGGGGGQVIGWLILSLSSGGHFRWLIKGLDVWDLKWTSQRQRKCMIIKNTQNSGIICVPCFVVYIYIYIYVSIYIYNIYAHSWWIFSNSEFCPVLNLPFQLTCRVSQIFLCKLTIFVLALTSNMCPFLITWSPRKSYTCTRTSAIFDCFSAMCSHLVQQMIYWWLYLQVPQTPELSPYRCRLL